MKSLTHTCGLHSHLNTWPNTGNTSYKLSNDQMQRPQVLVFGQGIGLGVLVSFLCGRFCDWGMTGADLMLITAFI